MASNIMKQIQRATAKGLSAFQDQPKQAKPPRGPRPAAVAQSAPNTPNPITDQKLRPGAPRVGEFSVLGYYNVPAGVIHRIPAGRPLRLFIKAQATQETDSGGAKTLATPGIIRSSQGQPTLPVTFHPDVSAWGRVDGVWFPCEITSIDYDAQEVSVDAPNNTERVEVYYVHGDGEYRFRVYRELGISDTSAATVTNGSIASIHLVDQKNLETMIRWPRYVGLVPSQRLALEISSNLPHVLNARSGLSLHLQAYSQRVTVTDPSALRRAAEIDMREGV